MPSSARVCASMIRRVEVLATRSRSLARNHPRIRALHLNHDRREYHVRYFGTRPRVSDLTLPARGRTTQPLRFAHVRLRFSFSKSGELVFFFARTPCSCATFSSEGTARCYSRSVSSHNTRAIASASFRAAGSEFTPLGRSVRACCPARTPTRIFTSAKRLCATVSVSRLP